MSSSSKTTSSKRLIKPNIVSVTAFGPATSANIMVGFDILGFAVEGIGDVVTLIKRSDKLIVIESIESQASSIPINTTSIPMDINKNTAGVVIQHLCQKLRLSQGFSIRIQKGIPLSSGLGGSAASAVAALVALNAFLLKPLTRIELAEIALLAETMASGEAHADNIAPCFFGGLTLIQCLQPLRVLQLPVPNIVCSLFHPHVEINTKEARQILHPSISLKNYVLQSSHLASFLVALYQENTALLKESMIDYLIESQRAPLLPDYYALKTAAYLAGALAISFSGSGPTLFAWSLTKETAEKINRVMQTILADKGMDSDQWITSINRVGAHITDITEYN